MTGMGILRYRLLLFIALSLRCGGALAMPAADKESIRSLSNQAAQDYDEGRYEAALDKFQRAYTIAKVPKLAVWLARTQDKLGRLVESSEHYREALSLQRNELWKSDQQQLAQADAEAELQRLQSRIPRLTVRVETETEDFTVTVDDTAIPKALLGVERPVDPGTREVVAKHGADVVHQTVILAEGDTKAVTLKLTPEAPLSSESTLTRHQPL